ncbi:hypothetical protein [Kordia sp.]|uniref:hypothetical protein n=1 Tax=Kordia sp. TaxID=1965332 RepID=UPI003D2A0A42
MKFIYYINKIAFIITIGLYITVYLGMLMQVLLGGVQVIFFFILLFNYDKFTKIMQRHLLTYGTLSAVFLICFFSSTEFFGQNWIFLIFIPMSLATYFTYIVYQLKQQSL